MKIPFHRPHVSDNEIEAAVDVIRSGWTTMGKKTIEFEEAFRKYIGSSHAAALNSATAALHLALKVIDLKRGDEVLIPTITFAATAEVICYFDAVPVMVDVDRDTHLIDVKEIEKKITDKTKAIIPVHYAGQPCDMEEIHEIAERYNLFVIEDAAHSLPAWYKGEIIGAISDITCFSFYATKTLSIGEGGMVLTDNEDWANRIKTLRLHGISSEAWKRYSGEGSWMYDVEEPGYKYNTSDINAAMGIVQLNKLEWMWRKRVHIAQRYNDAFSGIDGLIPYHVKDDRVSAWHLYPLKIDIDSISISRDQFIEEMKLCGISTSVHFIPLYMFSYYKGMGYNSSDYPNSNWVFDREISLPIFPDMTVEEIDYVSGTVIDLIKKFKK